MLPVLLVEPASCAKRRHYADSLLHVRGRGEPNLEEIKGRLKEIRNDSITHQESLVEALTKRFSGSPGVAVTLAGDADQAVRTIRAVSKGSMIAVSKSAVVAKELLPHLTEAGLRVVETYDHEWKGFQSRFHHVWQLPKIESRPLLSSTDIAGELGALREANVQRRGSKDFTGLLGVNALAVEEGTILLLQHSRNIRKVFEQARDLILVAGIDKVVRNLEHALFQTKCMALFGLEPLLLGMHGAGNGGVAIDALPYGVPGGETSRSIHLLLLDNGRSRIRQGRYAEILNCIGCRACTKGCAASEIADGPGRWSPKEYTHFLIRGEDPFPGFCLQCKSCRSNCPLDIDLPGMILHARTESAARGRLPLADTLLAKAGTLEKYGSSVSGVANAMASARPLRWLAEKVLDVSSKRQLPKLKRKTFAKWFRSDQPEP